MNSKWNKNNTKKQKCAQSTLKNILKSRTVYITHKSQYPATIRDFTWLENVCNGNILILLEIQPNETSPAYFSIFYHNQF